MDKIPKLPKQPLAFALHYMRYYRWPLLAILFFEIGQSSCQVMITYAVKGIIDLGTKFNGNVDEVFTFMWPAIKIFLIFALGILFFSRASGTILVLLAPIMRQRVRREVFHYLQNHSQKYFIGNFAGSVANRISEVSQGVNHTVWSMLFDFSPVIVVFSLSLRLLYGAHQGLAQITAALLLTYITISFLLASRGQKLAKEWAATRSKVSGKIVDSVTNAMNAKLFSRLGFERTYLDGYLNAEVKAARRTLWFMEIMRWFQFIFSTVLQVGLILLAMRYWVTGEITVGSFAMVSTLVLQMVTEARGLSRRFMDLFEYLGNIADGVKMIIQDHEVKDVPNAKEFVVNGGRIDFDKVDFQYNEGRSVFNKLNVSVLPGQRVGLVGFSGSGKTTFVNLILRMYDVQGGAIKIDGQSVSEVTQESLRAQVSLIPQEPMLFHRTLRENIRYGDLTASDEDVVKAARLAKAHDFIQNTPDRYDALVGERGVKLSGGQRQRIAIARAILKNAPILIMDEATSSLDSVTEKAIQNAMDTLMKNKTVIVVAHRLSTIAHLNRILVFDEGQIVEDGTHDELLEKKGHYYRLWSMQAGGFLPQVDPSHHVEL